MTLVVLMIVKFQNLTKFKNEFEKVTVLIPSLKIV